MLRQDNSIASFSVNRRITLTMAILGLLVLGVISLQRLPLEYLPAFSSSSITVSAQYRSSSPEEVERLVVQPLEESLGTINGIDTMSASADGNSGRIRITFVDGTDMDMAAVDVRDRIDRVRHRLPDDLERVNVRRFQSTDIPVIRFDLSAQWPTEVLFDFAENTLQRRLERLPGVAQVDISGIRTPQILVELDPDRLQAHRVGVQSVAAELRAGNLNLSAGDIDEGGRRVLVRSVGEFETLDQVRNLPIGEGGSLRLADVADVSYALPRQESFNFLNGTEALTVRVNKISTANLLEVADGVRAELDNVLALPAAEGLSVNIFADASNDVRKGLSQLQNSGLVGGVLAILAVFFFIRRMRATALVAIAIPISVIASFVIMYFLRQSGTMDLTLNVVSLAGLMLALGMLVDNSIVVIESIFRHRSETSEDARTAAIAGTSEVALPIVASTATTLCVFLPIIFMQNGGRMQLYLKNIATTVSIVMTASLVIALTVVPMVASFLLKKETARTSSFVDRLSAGYGRVLRATLRHRLVFLTFAIAVLGGAGYLFTTIERSFSAGSEERQVIIQTDTPPQYSLEQIHDLYREVYETLAAHQEQLDIADIAYAYDRQTGRSRASWRRSRRFEIYLVDEEESHLTTAEAREKIRAILPTKAGVNFRFAQGRGFSGNTGIELELSGDDMPVLELLAERVTAELERIPTLRDVDTSLESGEEEIRVLVDQTRIAAAGLSTQSVALTVNRALGSRPQSYFRSGERELDIILQYREEDRETLDQLKNVPIYTAGLPVPLGAFAEFERKPGPKTIERENHRPKIMITANTTKASASFSAMRDVGRIMAAFSLPPGYSWSFGRWNRFQQRDQQSSTFALLFAAVLIYLLMAALFESLVQPLTIMFSVPFALIGVAVVMKLASQPLDTMTTIGLIVLLGVVVNNAIVLIDHINHLRDTGMERTEAILRGGRNRLRPILITAVTTIVGLSPMVAPILLPQWFGPVEGRAGTWAPIGLVIMGGLTTSTFLTLVIIPTLYSVIDDASTFMRRVVRTAQT